MADNNKEINKTTCGDYGGVKHNGEPCTRPAGWGTEKDKGKCKAHREDKLAKNQDIKKKFLDKLKHKVISIKKASEKVGYHPSTIWKWRQKDEEFDMKVREAKRVQRDLRSEKVKDVVFKRIMQGDASSSVTIFWLKNNTGWKNNPETVVNVQQKQQSVSEGSEVSDRVVEKLERLKSSQSVDKKED